MRRPRRPLAVICLTLLIPTILCGQVISPESALPVIEWRDAAQYVDQEVIVQGKIVAAKKIAKICFLNFDTARSFTAVIHESNFKNFPESPEKAYVNQLVRIRGVISEYKGKPQIEVIRPDQVRILEKAEPVTPAPTTRPADYQGIVTIGTLNVCNLFDDHDDPYHADEGTPAKPKDELAKLAATIRAVNADVLALQEVEHRGYLELFVGAYLKDMGYRHIVCIDSNDQRGIDCAVLSRLPVGPVTSYRHLRFPDGTGQEMWFRRDLLQVRIEPPGGPDFSVFVVHLKSKRGSGEATEKYRVGEARQTRKILDGLLEQDKNARFVICGDFNDEWDSAPLKTIQGTGPGALRDFLSDLPKDAVTFNKPPRGMIDFILASPAMGAGYVAKSYRILPGSAATSGSDHNPVLARFDLQGGR